MEKRVILIHSLRQSISLRIHMQSEPVTDRATATISIRMNLAFRGEPWTHNPTDQDIVFDLNANTSNFDFDDPFVGWDGNDDLLLG